MAKHRFVHLVCFQSFTDDFDGCSHRHGYDDLDGLWEDRSTDNNVRLESARIIWCSPIVNRFCSDMFSGCRVEAACLHRKMDFADVWNRNPPFIGWPTVVVLANKLPSRISLHE